MFVVDNVAFEDNGFVLLPFKYICTAIANTYYISLYSGTNSINKSFEL